jgi:hypothetical protein
MKKILLLALSLISLTSLFSSQAFAVSAAAPQAVTGYFVFKNTGSEVTGQYVALPASNAAENQGKGVTLTVKMSADSSGKGVTAQTIPQ